MRKMKRKINQKANNPSDQFEEKKNQDKDPHIDKEEIKIEEKFFIQDWLPIKDIQYGMIVTKDNRYIKILEIEPINFLLRSNEDRNHIVNVFFSWLKIAPVSLQFRVTNTYIDSTQLIRQLKESTKRETNKKVLERRDEAIQHIKRLSTKEALTKRFFIIYEYEGEESNGIKSNNIEDIYYTMQHVADMAKAYFSKMDNTIIVHDEENLFLASMLYKILNPASSLKETIQERIGRVYMDFSQAEINSGKDPNDIQVPAIHYIAPKGLSFEHSQYVVTDGVYQTYLYIRGDDGYKQLVTSGWIENLTNFGEGIDLNIFTKKKEKFRTMESVGRTIRIKRSETKDKGRNDDSIEELATSIDNNIYIRNRMRDNNEDLYTVATQIIITSTTLKELYRKKNQIMKVLRSTDMFTEDCLFRQEEAYRLSLPILDTDCLVYKKASRNFLTSSLASTYMFTAFELFDENGILLGMNAANSSLASVNIFNTQKYTNANVVILGTAGSGKTFLEMLLGYNLRLNNKQVFYILPHKGHEHRRACAEIGGSMIELAPGSKDCINVMAIRPAKELDLNLIEAEFNNDSLLTTKIHQIVTFIQLLMGKDEMTTGEETLLTNILTHLYERFGVTHDNDSIWINKKDRILKEAPIIGDLYNDTKKEKRLGRITIALTTFVEGLCKNMNGQTNVDLSNKYIVFNVSAASKQLLPAFAFIAIDCAYDTIKGDRVENCALFLDEVWKMMLNEYSAEYVLEIVKIIRGYGGSAILATQDLEDFLAFQNGIYGKGIINNASIKFFLKMQKREIEFIQDIVDLTTEEKKRIQRFDRGQAMFVTSEEKIPLFIRATKKQEEIFTTDTNKIRAMLLQKKKGNQDNVSESEVINED